jgi:hypothetical protein
LLMHIQVDVVVDSTLILSMEYSVLRKCAVENDS